MMKPVQKKRGLFAAVVAAGMLFGTSCAFDRYGGDFFAPVYGYGSGLDEFFFDVGYFDDDYYDDDYEDYYEDYYGDWWN